MVVSAELPAATMARLVPRRDTPSPSTSDGDRAIGKWIRLHVKRQPGPYN